MTDAHKQQAITSDVPPLAKAVLPPQGKIKVNRLKYDGSIGGMYKIWILDVILSIVTLGIYSFWAKTRMRKYMFGSFSLGSDRLEYTGTGKELFMGAIKFFPILIGFGIIYTLAPTILKMLLLVSFSILVPMLVFLSTRYRLSRIKWRGIRARLDGSPVDYALFSLKRAFFSFVSLGILIPASDIARYRYIANCISFGNIRAKFKGGSDKLTEIHILSFLVACGAVITFIILDSMMISSAFEQAPALKDYAAMAKAERSKISDEQVGFMVLTLFMAFPLGNFILTTVLGILVAMGARSFYRAALIREKLRGLVIGDLRFKSKITGQDLLWLKLGNFLIYVFTLGLGKPFAVQRKMRMISRCILVGGDLDGEPIKQAAAMKPNAVADGLDDIIGIELPI